MHSSERKEYEVTYTIGEKTYREQNYVIPTHQFERDCCQNRVVDYCFGERGTKASYYAMSLSSAPVVLFGAAMFGLATGITPLAAIGGIGGAISCAAVPCIAHSGCCCPDEVDPHSVTAEIITTQPQLQQHLQISCETTTVKVEEYNKKKSFMSFLEALEKSGKFKICDIIMHSRLIIEVPKIIIGEGETQFSDLYQKYQINQLFKKYQNTKNQLVLRIPFDIQHKREERSGSGYVEYIGINRELVRTSTDHRGREYQIGKAIEKLKVKRNYVITEGYMVLSNWWTSYTPHERKKDKIIHKKEKVSVKIYANGSVKIDDKYLEAYQTDKIDICNGTDDLFIGDVPFAQAVIRGSWKSDVITVMPPQASIPMQPRSSMQQTSANIAVAGVHRR